MKRIIFSIIISLFIISCSDNTAPERYADQSYYLCAILESGCYIDADHAVLFGKTKDISQMNSDLAITDAQVVLSEKDGDEIIQSIFLTWDQSAGGYIDPNEQILINAGCCYSIEVDYNDKEISGETTVPFTIHVYGDSLVSENPVWVEDPDLEQLPELKLEEANSNHPIQIGTANNDEFNLLTEFYCLEEYNDAEYTYPPGDDDHPVDNEEYMGDTHQYPRRNMSYYMYQPENLLVNYNCYQSSLLFYGKTEVSVYSIDSNYLKYLYKSDGYTQGGIKGGIGVLGSRSGKKLYTRVVK